jgi:hypothetical protein
VALHKDKRIIAITTKIWPQFILDAGKICFPNWSIQEISISGNITQEIAERE